MWGFRRKVSSREKHVMKESVKDSEIAIELLSWLWTRRLVFPHGKLM